MYKNIFLVLLSILSILFHSEILAQTSDSTIKKSLNTQVGTFYPNQFESSYPLYNGTQYYPYPFKLNSGIRNFLSEKLEPSTIIYDGMTYKNVPSMYDLVDGSLVIQHFDKFYLIQLHSERVESFAILGHTFIWLNTDSIKSTLAVGFYDLLYDGKLQLLAKRSKTLEEKALSSGLERNINEFNKYYIKKEGIYYAIDGKSDLLKLLKTQDRLIAKFIKSQNLKFNKNHIEASILSTVRYYNQTVK